eukprot:TRINITY_DN26656_c0_g5_i1.p1 TRINITY_DN26656_c0_g5~~TRINITY_DN26656_c0_g5_i1.p1  ORF type:complete len:228 (-),score=41.08 TRINITY_DN26656_c0_g5_i1:457-1140(-)
MTALARSESQVRVLGASAACVGVAALGYLAWRHRHRQGKSISRQSPKEYEQNRSGDTAAQHVNVAEDIQRCVRVEEVLADLQSLGGASLRGHTLGGVPCRHRALVELSESLADYRRMLTDSSYLDFARECGGIMQSASSALQAVIDAAHDRHLVCEVGAGRKILELDALAEVISELFERHHQNSVRREQLDEERAEMWEQDKKAAWSRFKEHIQQCLKAANPWVMYD